MSLKTHYFKGRKMSLGEIYLDKFKIGDYVRWRTIIRDSNYDEYYKEQWGIIVNFKKRNENLKTMREVHYAMILENTTGMTIPVLLHKIHKVETN
jgi:hypothetical protein